jgi:hypothetical protein
MWDSVKQSTDLKVCLDLFHLLNLCLFLVISKWMNYLMLIILFELPVTLLESIKVFKEREHRLKVIS